MNHIETVLVQPAESRQIILAFLPPQTIDQQHNGQTRSDQQGKDSAAAEASYEFSDVHAIIYISWTPEECDVTSSENTPTVLKNEMQLKFRQAKLHYCCNNHHLMQSTRMQVCVVDRCFREWNRIRRLYSGRWNIFQGPDSVE